MNIKRILVGLDGSPREGLVLAAAQELAQRFDAHLILLRAVGLPPEVPEEAWKNPELTLEEYLKQRAEAALSKCASTLTAAVAAKHTVEVTVATPWQGLCSAAQAHNVDLLVIGSHGYAGLDRVLGTTAARVVNHAPCSVIVIRSPERRVATADSVGT